MALIALKTDPTKKELRQFACLWAPLFCAVLGYLLWRKENAAGTWLWGIGAFVVLVGLVKPTLVRPPFLGLIYLTAPIGWVVSHLVLAVVYYLIVTPIGFLLRLAGRDAMSRRFEPEADTYWKPGEGEKPIKRYFRQY